LNINLSILKKNNKYQKIENFYSEQYKFQQKIIKFSQKNYQTD